MSHEDDFDEFLSERIENGVDVADEELDTLLDQVEKEDVVSSEQQQHLEEEEEIVFENLNEDREEELKEEKLLNEKLSSIIIQKKKRKIKRAEPPTTNETTTTSVPLEEKQQDSTTIPTEDIILTEQQLSLMMNGILNKFGKIIEIPSQEYIEQEQQSFSSFENKNLQRKLIQMDYLIKEMRTSLEKAIIKLALMRKQKQEIKANHKQEKKEWIQQKEKEIDAVKKFYENFIKEKHQMEPPSEVILPTSSSEASSTILDSSTLNETVNSIWNWFGQKK